MDRSLPNLTITRRELDRLPKPKIEIDPLHGPLTKPEACWHACVVFGIGADMRGATPEEAMGNCYDEIARKLNAAFLGDVRRFEDDGDVLIARSTWQAVLSYVRYIREIGAPLAGPEADLDAAIDPEEVGLDRCPVLEVPADLHALADAAQAA